MGSEQPRANTTHTAANNAPTASWDDNRVTLGHCLTNWRARIGKSAYGGSVDFNSIIRSAKEYTIVNTLKTAWLLTYLAENPAWADYPYGTFAKPFELDPTMPSTCPAMRKDLADELKDLPLCLT